MSSPTHPKSVSPGWSIVYVRERELTPWRLVTISIASE
jgi:hypothetical protein